MNTAHQIVTTGRRKDAVARARVSPGTGKIEINGRPFEEYFPTTNLQGAVLQPLQVANSVNAFDVSVNAHGGGLTGQAGAVRLAIARALLQGNEELRKPLREQGLLTRDPRMKERKKPGQPGARRRFQFSKR
jgi:small subunit ribosomal protein S9